MHIMVGQGRRFTGLQQGRDLSSQSGTLNEACTTQDMDIAAINKHKKPQIIKHLVSKMAQFCSESSLWMLHVFLMCLGVVRETV